jgi:hypothetical protein
MTKLSKTKGRRPTRDDPEQSRAFIKKAREIEADDDHSGADELMKYLHRRKPEPHVKNERTRKQKGG